MGTKLERDFALGEKFELVVARALNNANENCRWQKAAAGYYPFYDLKCANPHHVACPKIECKYDEMSRDFDTFLLEVAMLKDSTADEVYLGDGHELFIFNLRSLRPTLRTLLKEKKAWIINVGDGKRTRCVKVHRSTLARAMDYQRMPFDIKGELRGG